MKDKRTLFSIIIPTHNRPHQLADCIRSMAKLDYPRDCFEVIVVDDGSLVSPESVVAPFRTRLEIKLLTQNNAGPAAARNTGAKHSKGKFLAFTDDDCIPAPDWLQVLASRFRETPDCVVGGRTINLLTDNIYSTTSQLIVEVVYRHYNAEPNHSRFFATNNMALPRDFFFLIGEFDSNFTTSEDREFCDRCLHRRYQMIYAPEALVYHAHSLKFHTFCRQHFNYGRGAFRFHLKRSRRESAGVLPDFKFHLNLRNWLLYPFSRVEVRQSISLAMLLIVWQAVNAAGFFWEGVCHRIRGMKNTRCVRFDTKT